MFFNFAISHTWPTLYVTVKHGHMPVLLHASAPIRFSCTKSSISFPRLGNCLSNLEARFGTFFFSKLFSAISFKNLLIPFLLLFSLVRYKEFHFLSQSFTYIYPILWIIALRIRLYAAFTRGSPTVCYQECFVGLSLLSFSDEARSQITFNVSFDILGI